MNYLKNKEESIIQLSCFCDNLIRIPSRFPQEKPIKGLNLDIFKDLQRLENMDNRIHGYH